RQQKRFPHEHFAFARQQKRFPREHFAFARQQERFPRWRRAGVVLHNGVDPPKTLRPSLFAILICSGETLSVNDPLLILGSGLQGHELLQTPTLSTLALKPLRSCRHVRLQSTPR